MAEDEREHRELEGSCVHVHKLVAKDVLVPQK